MENIREITLNSQEPVPHEAPDFAVLKTRVTPEDIENLRKSLIPQRLKRFDMIDRDKQAEYAVLFKFSEEELKQLIPFLTSDGVQTFSMNTIGDALDFLEQGIAGGNGKFRNLKKFVKEWRESNVDIYASISKDEKEYKEADTPKPEELILDFMIMEGEVTPEDISGFKEKLLFDGKKIFDKLSSVDQIEFTAFDKMSIDMWRRVLRVAVTTKEKRLAKLHNVLGILNFLMLQTKPDARKKYEELERFTKKLWGEINRGERAKENKKSETEAPAKAMVA